MTLTTPVTALLTIISLSVYVVLSAKVGQARRRYKVPAPATQGPSEFMRVRRVQDNTVEQLLWFLPVLWLAALSVGDLWAAAVGSLWPIGRIIYARSYYADPEKRGPGFGLTILPSFALTAMALFGVLRSLL